MATAVCRSDYIRRNKLVCCIGGFCRRNGFKSALHNAVQHKTAFYCPRGNLEVSTSDRHRCTFCCTIRCTDSESSKTSIWITGRLRRICNLLVRFRLATAALQPLTSPCVRDSIDHLKEAFSDAKYPEMERDLSKEPEYERAVVRQWETEINRRLYPDR